MADFNMNRLFKSCNCPVCGKAFIPAPSHVYKARIQKKTPKKAIKKGSRSYITIYYCSYKCWCAAGMNKGYGVDKQHIKGGEEY